MADRASQNEMFKRSIDAVVSWVETHRYRGYDPADGNASPLRWLTLGRVLPRRILQQVVLRAPFNIRPLLGIPALESTKGRGYMAWGYAVMFRRTSEARYRDGARICLQWLMDNRAPRYDQYCWGNDFHYATRTGKLPKHEPTIVWSSLIGQAFMEAYETFGDPRYLEVAVSVCDWITRLPRKQARAGTCLSYVAFRQTSIHNSNMLGAALLARVARVTGDGPSRRLAREAMLYSCTSQRPDGSWCYGEDPQHHWIDNFHTGYNLECLNEYMRDSGDASFEKERERGYTFFKRNFFAAEGAPKYYHNRLYPIDIQSAAQAIDTFVTYASLDTDALVMAEKVADWTIRRMQTSDGHFCYRDLGWTRVRTPMIHWGQATMFKALARLAAVLTTRSKAP